MSQPTQQPCPSSPDGGSHHLVPERVKGSVAHQMVCRYCHKTEAELREQA